MIVFFIIKSRIKIYNNSIVIKTEMQQEKLNNFKQIVNYSRILITRIGRFIWIFLQNARESVGNTQKSATNG